MSKMNSVFQVIGIFFLLGVYLAEADRNLDWWKHAVFYQIYPRSFADSNGDGNGDLRGIAHKAEYFKELGVDGVWLSPIYVSPLKDGGYDVSDYRKVNPLFGNNDDLKYLKEQLHKNGVKLILDFVPNHSSDEHEWFKKSVQKEGKYNDYYVWTGDNENKIPNNWLSVFDNKEHSWTWHPTRKQWYLRQFGSFQPDLNFRSSHVQTEIKNVIEYWLQFGIDGFRIDSCPYLFENENFENDVFNSSLCNDKESFYCYDHINSKDQPETFQQIYNWRSFIDKYSTDNNEDTKVIMAEAYTSPENTFKLYGQGNQVGAHFAFNFNLISYLSNSSTANDFVKTINDWLLNIPENFISNWVLGNHDNFRVATRLGKLLNADALNMLTGVLPGIMVTYMGEEIGMKNVHVPYKDAQDHCQNTEELYYLYCRDPERTPFPWNNSVSCGFSSNSTSWLPSGNCEINLADQVNNSMSSFEIYKNLIKLRKDAVLRDGTTKVSLIDQDVFIVNRTLNDVSAVLLINVGDSKTINVTKGEGKKNYRVRLVSPSTSYKVDDEVDLENITLAAHDGILLFST